MRPGTVENLEAKITNSTRLGSGGTVRVTITADGDREEDFENVRDAVKEALGDE